MAFTGLDWMLRHKDFHLLLGHRETPQFRIAPPDADLDDLLAEDSVSQQSNGTTDSNIFHPSVVHISKHKQNILIVATK